MKITLLFVVVAVAIGAAMAETPSHVHLCNIGADVPAAMMRMVPRSDFGLYVAATAVPAPVGCKSLDVADVAARSAFLVRARQGDAPLRQLLNAFPSTVFFRIPSTTDFFFVSVEKAADSLEGMERYLYGVEREALLFVVPEDANALAGLTMPRAPLKIASGDAAALRSKADFIGELDGDEYYECMEYLTGEKEFVVGGTSYLTRTRSTYSVNHTYAALYIADYFEQFGDYIDEVFFQDFTFSGTATQNVIAVKQGTDLADEIIVVGGHYDSTSQQPQTLAPGCIDNGSGTDGVMNILRAAARYGFQPRRTIHFIAFGGEEQGLHGSNHYVNTRGSNGYNVISALTMDMIGYSNRYFGVMIEGTNDPAISALMDLVSDNTSEFSPELTQHLSYFSFGSDHIPFQRAGIPAILAIEQDDTNYPGYHSTTDQINYLNVNQSIGILRGVAGSLWDCSASN